MMIIIIALIKPEVNSHKNKKQKITKTQSKLVNQQTKRQLPNGKENRGVENV
jgi:hypothetical protein